MQRDPDSCVMWFTLTCWRRTAEAALQLAAAAVTEKVDWAPTFKSAEKKSHCEGSAKPFQSITGFNVHVQCPQTRPFILGCVSLLLIHVDFSKLSHCNRHPVTVAGLPGHHISHQTHTKKAKQLLSHPRQTDRMTDIALSQCSPGSCCSVF